MELTDATTALDEATAAVHRAATDVLATIVADIAVGRPGATLRITPWEYEPGCEIDVVGGGPVTALYKFVDEDTLRIARRAAEAVCGIIDGVGPIDGPLIVTPH